LEERKISIFRMAVSLIEESGGLPRAAADAEAMSTALSHASG